MNHAHRQNRCSLAIVLLAAAGCGGDAPATTADGGATSAAARALRGTVPTQLWGAAVTRVNVIDASSGRTVASAAPNAQGAFAINNVPKGATYRVSLQAGSRAVPLVFAKSQGAVAKTNLFKVGTATAPRGGSTDGPLDVGNLQSTEEGGEGQVTPSDPANAPNLQEDYDNDGIPDAMDPDADGDGTPNAMDADGDNNGTPDNEQFADQDGDLTCSETFSDLLIAVLDLDPDKDC